MLTVIVLTRCEEEDFMADISAKETNLWISIGGKTFPNPCKSSTCPSGEKCTIQYVPRLLKMPIAHCIESTATLNDGSCCNYLLPKNNKSYCFIQVYARSIQLGLTFFIASQKLNGMTSALSSVT